MICMFCAALISLNWGSIAPSRFNVSSLAFPFNAFAICLWCRSSIIVIGTTTKPPKTLTATIIPGSSLNTMPS